jgi:hypothetical protein
MILFLWSTACFLLVSLSSSALFPQEPSWFWRTFTLIEVPAVALLSGRQWVWGHGEWFVLTPAFPELTGVDRKAISQSGIAMDMRRTLFRQWMYANKRFAYT